MTNGAENQYKYVNSSEQLLDMCEEIEKNAKIIALDTEFIRKNTYYPILCLIQINYYDENNSAKNFVIDVLEKNLELDIFYKTILNNQNIKKVIHSFSQDLEALATRENFKIKNVDDTQLMAEFCYCNTNLSYSHLAEQILQIEFKKSSSTQKSNWKKRPLSEKQKKYAAEDVIFLIPIYKILEEKLKKIDNYNLYMSEVEHQIKIKDKEYILNNVWKRMKFNCNKKNLNYVFLLKELCSWREKKAMEANVPRFNIMENSVLEEIVKFKPKTIKKFSEIFTYSGHNINLSREMKREIINIILDFDAHFDPTYEEIIFYASESHFIYKELLEKIYEEIKVIVETRRISLNLAINKCDIIALIMKYENKENILYGWKDEVFGDVFKKI